MDRQEIYDVIDQLRLMDDDFMVMVFDNDKECVELVLNIILGRDDLKVIEATTQREYKSVTERSVRFDIFARDSSGKAYDIEIQRSDKGAGKKRARFYSSALDSRMLKKGSDFDKLAESYVIFITERDVMGKGLPLYTVDRTVLETGEVFGDGAHIIYVNGEYKNAETPLGRLMEDFRSRSTENINYAGLKRKIEYFKKEEKGREAMCKIIEDLNIKAANEGEERGKEIGEKIGNRKAQVNNALTMIKDGNLPYEMIAKYSGLSVDEVVKLAEGDLA